VRHKRRQNGIEAELCLDCAIQFDNNTRAAKCPDKVEPRMVEAIKETPRFVAHPMPAPTVVGIDKWQSDTRIAEPSDNVNHPAHYAKGGIECIDAIEAAVTGLEGFEGMCTGNAIKYLFRWKHKNGVEDLKKAAWYVNRLIQRLEGMK
jgi:hypothetical protein